MEVINCSTQVLHSKHFLTYFVSNYCILVYCTKTNTKLNYFLLKRNAVVAHLFLKAFENMRYLVYRFSAYLLFNRNSISNSLLQKLLKNF